MFPVLLLTHTPTFFHVENVAKDSVAVEVEDPEGQEEQQDYEVADPAEDQAVEANFANSDSQPGKHRFIPGLCTSLVLCNI